jgi:branched-chain amino acid transport system ATP-binding protein
MNESTRDPLLGAAGLRYLYGGLAAVDGVTLTLEAGARHAVVGPNGAGKTTLLDLLSGLLRPSAGVIMWRGRDITRWPLAHRARAGIGRTFQTPTVVASLSTVDNLVLGAWPGARRPRWAGGRYRQLATQASEQASRLGLAAQAQTPAGALSHGQRRVLDLGMALAGQPRLLLLDEPAAGLSGTADLDRLMRVLNGLPPTMSLLLVEHHLDVVAAVARTVTVLHQGRVLAAGPIADVAADAAVARAYPGLGAVRRVAG